MLPIVAMTGAALATRPVGRATAPRSLSPARRTVTALLTGASLNACVVGGESTPNAVQLARGAPPAVRGGRTAGTVLTEATMAGRAAVEEVPSEERPGFVWVRGYYHYDGARYVYVPGRWERRPALTGPE